MLIAAVRSSFYSTTLSLYIQVSGFVTHEEDFSAAREAWERGLGEEEEEEDAEVRDERGDETR